MQQKGKVELSDTYIRTDHDGSLQSIQFSSATPLRWEMVSVTPRLMGKEGFLNGKMDSIHPTAAPLGRHRHEVVGLIDGRTD